MLVKPSLQLRPKLEKNSAACRLSPRALTSEQLPIVTRYFTGKAFAQSDPRTLQIGWARNLSAHCKAATKNQRRGVSSRGEYSRGCSENRVRSSRWKNGTASVHHP